MSHHNYRSRFNHPHASQGGDSGLTREQATLLQQQILQLNRERHLGLSLGPTGADGDFGALSRGAFDSITRDDQATLLAKVGLPTDFFSRTQVAQTTPVPSSPQTGGSPLVSAGPPSAGERAFLQEADRHLASLPAATPAVSAESNSVNEAILKFARSHEGTKYDLYDKNGGINCSTFVAQAVTAASRAGREPTTNIHGTSEQQILAAHRVSESTRLPYFRTADLLNPDTVGQLQPGMMIGIAYDHKRWGFEAGRANNMAHIGVIVRDEKGRLSVAASDGGKGVEVTPLTDWTKLNGKYDPTGVRYYVAQPFTRLAQAPEAPTTEFAHNTEPVPTRVAQRNPHQAPT